MALVLQCYLDLDVASEQGMDYWIFSWQLLSLGWVHERYFFHEHQNSSRLLLVPSFLSPPISHPLHVPHNSHPQAPWLPSTLLNHQYHYGHYHQYHHQHYYQVHHHQTKSTNTSYHYHTTLITISTINNILSTNTTIQSSPSTPSLTSFPPLHYTHCQQHTTILPNNTTLQSLPLTPSLPSFTRPYYSPEQCHHYQYQHHHHLQCYCHPIIHLEWSWTGLLMSWGLG